MPIIYRLRFGNKTRYNLFGLFGVILLSCTYILAPVHDQVKTQLSFYPWSIKDPGTWFRVKGYLCPFHPQVEVMGHALRPLSVPLPRSGEEDWRKKAEGQNYEGLAVYRVKDEINLITRMNRRRSGLYGPSWWSGVLDCFWGVGVHRNDEWLRGIESSDGMPRRSRTWYGKAVDSSPVSREGHGTGLRWNDNQAD